MKRGRPTLPAHERKALRVCVRLDAAEQKQLDTLTRDLDLTESDVLRYALRAFCLPGVTT
jgi:hypothetical protein